MSNLDGPAHPKPVVIEEEEDKQPTKAAASEFHRQPPLLDMHYSPSYKMAKQNIIPRQPADRNVTRRQCLSLCKSHQQAMERLTQGGTDWEQSATRRREEVSVDQLVLPNKGHIA